MPPLPKISISGIALAVSATFLKANGLKIEPVVPPAAYFFYLPTPTIGSPLGKGSCNPGIVLVKVTAWAPFFNADAHKSSAKP